MELQLKCCATREVNILGECFMARKNSHNIASDKQISFNMSRSLYVCMDMRERKNMNLKKHLSERERIIPLQNIVIYSSLAFPSFQVFQPPEFCTSLITKSLPQSRQHPEQDLWKVTEPDVLLLSRHLPITILLTAGKEQPLH